MVKKAVKFLFLIFAMQVFLFAASNTKDTTTDEKIVNAIKKAIRVGKAYNLKDIKVKAKKKLDKPVGWSAYFLSIFLEIHRDNNMTEVIEAADTVFSDGTYLAKDLLNLKTGGSIKRDVALDLTPKYYKKDHLIAGNAKAKNKLVVFSDPECPFCQDFVPELIKFVKKHPKQFVLYYYHFPLDVIHKASPTLIRVIMAAEKKLKMSQADLLIKVYEHYFDIPTTDADKILEVFNKAFKTKITKKEIHTPEIEKRFKNDFKMASDLVISGTPTLYLNGKKDASRRKHLELLKKSK